MSNKFEEMNYLIDKLKDKKQKELKRVNNEFNNLFTKRKEKKTMIMMYLIVGV